jgi:hypothetical protein
LPTPFGRILKKIANAEFDQLNAGAKIESFRMSSLLEFLKISDSYDRKARFFPAFLVVLPLVAFAMSLRLPDESWIMKLLVAGGAGSALVVALSQMASAAGNLYGASYWRKRGGLPTTRWLRASDDTHSKQQKRQWYEGIKQLTDLDIPTATAARPAEEDAIIADAIRQIRNSIRGKAIARMVDKHNEEYGFVRNLAGLRWALITTSASGAVSCATALLLGHGTTIGCIFSGCFLIYAVAMFFLLPGYVETAANRYAESLLSIRSLSAI